VWRRYSFASEWGASLGLGRREGWTRRGEGEDLTCMKTIIARTLLQLPYILEDSIY
jgi:hypothetical protein